MDTTTNYELNKPAQSDYYNVADFNENADILDEALNSIQTDLSSLSNRTTPVNKGGTGRATLTSNAVLAGNSTSAVKQITTKSGALYATGNNVEPQFGVLPVGQGGTGTTTAQQARANLGITPNNIGAVSKAGDIMTGNLSVSTSSFPVFSAANTTSNKTGQFGLNDDGNLTLVNRTDDNNLTWISVEPALANNRETTISIYRRVAGEQNRFQLFGNHNTSLLAAAINSLIQNGSIHMIKSIQQGIVNTGTNRDGTIPIASGTNLNNCTWFVNGSLGDTMFMIRRESNALHWYFTGSTGTLIPWEVVEYYV